MRRLRNKFILGILLLITVIGIPLVVSLTQQKQETRSHAGASTTLYYTPTTSQSSPLNKQINDATSFDVMVNPGTNQVSFVKLEVDYDPTKLQPTSNPFTVNTASFPIITEGPILQNGKILISVTIGADPSKAIKTITKVGTINLTAISLTSTSQPTAISFGSVSQVLSVAPSDQASENVLSTTTPAYIAINTIPTPTPTNAPIPTPTPVRKAGDGGNAGKGGGSCGSLGSNGGLGNSTTGGTGGTGGTGCSGTGGTGSIGGLGGHGGLGSSSGPGNPGENGNPGTGSGAGGAGGGGGGGAPGQPGGRGGDGGTGCNGAPGQAGLPGGAAPNAYTGGVGGRGGDGGPDCNATPTPTSAPIPTPTKVPTPTPLPLSTKLSFTVFIHGIGNSGDNANPTAFSLSNKNPLHTTRAVDIQILNSSNVISASASGNIVYDGGNGNFKGVIDFGLKIPSSGSYSIKAKEATHLRRLVSGIQTITIGQTVIVPEITLVAGDVNGDNTISILDYNLLIGCYSDFSPAKSCTSANKLLTDLNDDGNVNQTDYNLFLREISVQNGQ
jgi:hypothetical protein